MRKISLLIITLLLSLCFIACGQETIQPPTEGKHTAENAVQDSFAGSSATTEDNQPALEDPDTEALARIEWELRDVKTPENPALEMHKVEIYEGSGITTEVYDTGINLNHATIADVVSNNDWISKELDISINEGDNVCSDRWSGYDTVYGVSHKSEISGISKGEPWSKYTFDEDFSLFLRHDSWKFTGYNYIYCYVRDMTGRDFSEAQTGLYELFSKLVGADLAECLVYGADADNADSSDDIERLRLSETITIGQIPFVLTRNLGAKSIYLQIEVDEGELGIRKNDYFQNGNATFYSDMKYTFADFFDLDSVGGIDSIDALFSKYWKAVDTDYTDYKRTVIDFANISRTHYYNGQDEYRIYAELTNPGIESSNIDIDLMFTEQDGTLVDISCEIEGQTAYVGEQTDNENEQQKLVEETNALMDKHFGLLFPNADTSLTEQNYRIGETDGLLTYTHTTGGNFHGYYGGTFNISFSSK